MKLDAMNLAAVTVLAALLAAVGPARAGETGWRPFISVTPTYEGDADLDQGGDFSVWRAIVSGGVARDLGGGNSVGVTLNYSYSDYSFSNPTAFGGVAPWNIVQRYGVAVPLSFDLRDGWSVGFVPSVDWFRENGADTGESLAWGAIVSGRSGSPTATGSVSASACTTASRGRACSRSSSSTGASATAGA